MLTRRAALAGFVVCAGALAAFAGAHAIAREPARKPPTGVHDDASVERVVRRTPAIRTGLPAVPGSMRPLPVTPARRAPQVAPPPPPPPPASSTARGATATGSRPAAAAKPPAPSGAGGEVTIIEVP